MVEKIRVGEKDIWVVIEAHTQQISGNDPCEFFTASYHTADPKAYPAGVLLTDEQQAPVLFLSPVEALEYASEKLLGVLGESA